MKKTHNINLNGQVFCIDEDAYIQLQHYIETLEKYYLAEEDGKEIMGDIESRIAELLSGFLQQFHKEVISQTEIDQVIEIMGTPDVIIDEDSEHTTFRKKLGRKLYRDVDNSIIGGVASGIGSYLAIPVAWIRIAFILFTFFFGITIVVYIILWIAIPGAFTAKQKLEMQGEKINVSNIEKKIRNTYDEVKKNSKSKKIIIYIGEKLNIIVASIGEVLSKIIAVLLGALAIIGLLTGIFIFLTVGWCLLFSHYFIPENYYFLAQYACSPIPAWFIKLMIFFIINIPAFLIVYYSGRYLFKFQIQKSVLWVSVGIWILCGIISSLTGGFQMLNYSQQYEDKTEVTLTPANNKKQSLTVIFNPLCDSQYPKAIRCHLNDYILYCPSKEKQDSAILYLKAEINIKETNKNTPQLIINKKVNGISWLKAVENMDNMKFEYEWKNDTLHLNNYYALYGDRWRANQSQLTLLIPENYQITLTNPPRNNFSDYSIFPDYDRFLLDTPETQSYIMKNGKLNEIEVIIN